MTPTSCDTHPHRCCAKGHNPRSWSKPMDMALACHPLTSSVSPPAPEPAKGWSFAWIDVSVCWSAASYSKNQVWRLKNWCAKIEHQLFQLVIMNHLCLKDPVGIIRSFQLTTGQRRISQLIALRQEESQGQVLVTVKSCIYLMPMRSTLKQSWGMCINMYML